MKSQLRHGLAEVFDYGLLLVIFGLIALVVLTHSNQALFYQINALHHYLPAILWDAGNLIAYPRFFFLPMLLIALTYAWRHTQIVTVLVIVGIYYSLFYFLKVSIHEPRPYIALDQRTFVWLNHFEDAVKSAYGAFPSGHVGNMAIFVFSLNQLFFQKKPLIKVLLLVLLAFIMLARICTGWHWPGDVLASAALGFVIVKVCFALHLDQRFLLLKTRFKQ